ncbi:sec39-like protein [Dermatophagoides farinae]|uniref:Sec39-like protein n=1 Tax=Dermatophagoides farinae TaxID=6954 RepID=A0A9D4NZT7_DERFA|nr:sec39-like protein [Dermatophagoides farinae]
MDPTRSTNIFSHAFGQIYFAFMFYISYFIHLLKLPFIRRDNDGRFIDPIRPPKAIIDGLMENFDDSRLINANETVEDTYIRMIKSKQYETAMRLAKKFDLEIDLIYKNMWQHNEKSIHLIDECLAKINDQMWIINQCIDCIPRQLPVQRYLLQFGINLIAHHQQQQRQQQSEDSNVFNEIRTKLSIHLNRLDLYEKILKSKFGNDNDDFVDNFDQEFFRQFRQKNPFQLAIEHAHQADIETLSVLFAHEHRKLASHFFVILSNLPETLPPSNYKDLIELAISTLSNATDDDFLSITNIDDDDDYENKFYANNSDQLKFKSDKPVDEKYLTEWFEYRAQIILDLTMLIDYSLELLRIGIDGQLSRLEDLYSELDLYSLFVYENFTLTITFEKFRNLSIDEKMNLLFNGEKNDNILFIRNLFEKFFEKITVYCQRKQLVNVSRKELLRNFFLNISRMDFGQCLKIFEIYTIVNRTTEEIRHLKIIDDPCDLIELALECIRSYDRVSDLDLAFKLMECLPERDQAHLLNVEQNNDDDDDQWLDRFNRINDEADEIAFHLSMVEFLCENNTPITVKELIQISATTTTTTEKQLSFVKKVLNNFCKQRTTIDSLEWKQFFLNLKDLIKKYLTSISDEELIETTVRCLLWSNNEYFIQMAFNHIDMMESIRGNRSKKLNTEKGIQILRQVAKDYLKYAGSQPDDVMIKYARMCLDFIHTIDPNDFDTNDELNFIQALQLLNQEFPGKEWLPIRIKNIGQQDLLEMILSSARNAHTKIDEILKIIHLLNLFKSSDNDDNDDEEQEARLLNIIGEKAIENGDYKTANDLSIQIMDRNLGHGKSGWKLCYQICCLMNKELEFESLLTIDQRLRILSFVLAHCPDTDVNMHYDLLNQLKNLKQLHVNYLIEPKIYINFHNGQSTTLVQ